MARNAHQKHEENLENCPPYGVHLGILLQNNTCACGGTDEGGEGLGFGVLVYFLLGVYGLV